MAPPKRISTGDKQQAIDQFFKARDGELTAQNVQDCYHSIVDAGFRGKASHALRICFGAEANGYIHECFGLPERKNRLYQVRNEINHGEVDAENPSELARIEARLHRLWMIVWRMFGCFIPFSAPVDSNPYLNPNLGTVDNAP